MKSPVKIAYILNSMEAGGAQFPVPALFEVMRENGAAPHLFALSMRSGKAAAAMDAGEVSWDCAPCGKSAHFAAASWLLDELRRFQPDIIWTSLTQATLLGQWAGQRLNVPVISWQHNAFLKPANQLLLKWRKRGSRFWIMDSAAVADFSRQKLGLASENIEVWPIFRADPNFPAACVWRRGEPVRFSSLGRLHAAKGYDLLIAAMARLKENGFTAPTGYKVEIAGEGALKTELQMQAAGVGVTNIHFAGYRADSLDFITQAHVYVQPSRREGFCIAAHEAMACGLMPIAAHTGQLAFSINDTVNGRSFAVGDVDALANQLRQTLSAPQDIAAIGARARSDIQTLYSAQNFAAAGGHIMTRLKTLLPPANRGNY